MLKRTKGRLLLTLLVITGLAGTINITSLTKQERKFAVGHLKETKNNLLQSVKGLSEAQLEFKPAPDKWSIKECVYHIALSESALWGMLDATMKKEATPEKRTQVKLSDEDILKGVNDRSTKRTAVEMLQPGKAPWKNTAEALDAFKADRTNHIKYTKTSTEDFRNHMTELAFGWMDAYQVILVVSGHTARHTKQIEEIKADPAFPKK